MIIGADQNLTIRQSMDKNNIDSYSRMNFSKMDDKKLKDVSQQFESIFINELLKSMRDTVPKDDWLNAGMQQDIFEDMLYNEYSLNIAKQDTTGLGDMLFKYLKSTKNS